MCLRPLPQLGLSPSSLLPFSQGWLASPGCVWEISMRYEDVQGRDRMAGLQHQGLPHPACSLDLHEIRASALETAGPH